MIGECIFFVLALFCASACGLPLSASVCADAHHGLAFFSHSQCASMRAACVSSICSMSKSTVCPVLDRG